MNTDIWHFTLARCSSAQGSKRRLCQEMAGVALCTGAFFLFHAVIDAGLDRVPAFPETALRC